MGQTNFEIRTAATSSPIRYTKALMVAAIGLMATLRVIALDSDPYSHLSWSSALLTDEGFYIHNARNVALFGHATTDQFNNMLIMPTLHQVQVWVFSMWGVGAIQARAISVAAGILTLVVFYFAMKRSFGSQIAFISLLFLGLGHANLMYSRMALMDTPAALGLVCVFAGWVYGVYNTEAGLRGSEMLFGVSGAMIAVSYATRGLSAWIIPVAFAPLLYRAATKCGRGKVWIRAALSQAAGLFGGLAIYLFAWYLPHSLALGNMTSYYLSHQVLPHSMSALRGNITHALMGDSRGLSPYLFRHSPVEFGLAVAILLASAIGVLKGRPRTSGAKQAASESNRTSIFAAAAEELQQPRLSEMSGWFLAGWLLMAWITYSVISYSPDRYYVLFYPSMAALAAIAIYRARKIHAFLRGSWVQTALAGFLAYHAGEALLHHDRDWLLALFAVIVVGLFLPIAKYRPADFAWRLAYSPALLLVVWASINACWTTDWLAHLSYGRRSADRWLARSLPANSVLIGDVAPGLCLDNRFMAVSVIPGLCNGDAPLERFAGRPRYIVILDERFLEKYWTKRYPSELTYERRICLFPSIVKFPVGIYRVGDAPGPGDFTESFQSGPFRRVE